MKAVVVFLVAIPLAGFMNYLLSRVLSSLVKRESSVSERLRISSIEDARDVRRRGKGRFSKEDKMRLWGDAMNIAMTAESEESAGKYIAMAAVALDEDGVEFRAQATKIVEKRFGAHVGEEREEAQCSG